MLTTVLELFSNCCRGRNIEDKCVRETTAESNEAIVPIRREDTTEDQVSETVTNFNSLTYQSHVKSLTGIKNKDFETVVERLSKDCKISDHLKIKMLEVKTKNHPRGEHRLEGEKYYAVVIKREDELDIVLSSR